jgi:hypothetical protein
MGVSAIGSLKAVAAGPLRSKPAASSLPAMSCEVMSAMAAPSQSPRPPAGAMRASRSARRICARAFNSARWSLAVELV